MRVILILLVFVITIQCKQKVDGSSLEKVDETQLIEAHRRVLLDEFCSYFGDTLLHNKKELIRFYLEKHEVKYISEDRINKEDFEQPHPLKDINGDDKGDTVFVMSPNPAESGYSYCFFDTMLPSLTTESACCHPSNMFVIDDINEDGIREIGIFYSACSSRYKSLRLYTLKNDAWKEFGGSDFDILTQDPQKVDFSSLVIKVGKNKYRICNFIEGKTFWETMEMK